MKNFRTGMLVPWVNTTMEDEIPTIVDSRIGLHWSRLRPNYLPHDGHDSSYLTQLLDDVPNALKKFDGLDLNTIVLGCTSASIIDGCKSLEIPDNYRTKNFITAFEAVVSYIKKISAHEIMLFAPYESHVIDDEINALASRDIKVVKAIKIDYVNEIRFISPSDLYKIFLAEYSNRCDGVFFSCTALYTLDVISYLQQVQDVHTPIFSSNIAIAMTINATYENSDLYTSKHAAWSPND